MLRSSVSSVCLSLFTKFLIDMSSMWRKKLKRPLTKSALDTNEEEEDSLSKVDDDKVDWFSAAKIARGGVLEDSQTKAERLKKEGILLAEKECFHQALSKWNESLTLNDHQPELYEMKAQAFMEINDDFGAIKSAERAIHLVPNFCEAHRTLGRAQRNYGELDLALRSFARALHLQPWPSIEEHTPSIQEEISDVRTLLAKAKVNEMHSKQEIEDNAVVITRRKYIT